MGCGNSTAAVEGKSQSGNTTKCAPSGGTPLQITTVEPRAIGDITKEYEFLANGRLGEGAFGKVDKARRLSTGEIVAVKTVDEKVQDTVHEVSMLKSVSHPHIISFCDFLIVAPKYYLITELIEGGELFDRIVSKKHYSEYEARWVMKKLLKITKYLHDNCIAHRDYKPENLLLKSHEDNHDIRLVDFGFATTVQGRTLTTRTGTPGYAAPEILLGEPYGVEVDNWTCGVLAYILLCGAPPFANDQDILKVKYKFSQPPWENISQDAKDFVNGLLVKDQDSRLTADQCLEHPWMLADREELEGHALPAALEALKTFNANRKLKAAGAAVIAVVKMGENGSVNEDANADAS